MPSFSIFNGSTTPMSLTSGETGFIGQNGSLSTSGDAITASGGVDISILGSVNSNSGKAIYFNGSVLNLHVGSNGSLVSLKSDTVSARFSSSAYISSDGYLHSAEIALDLRTTDGDGSITVVNTGIISGKSDAIVTDSGTSTTHISNFGVITGGSGGIDHLAGNATVLNYGSITGVSYGYRGADQIDIVKNFGSIEGGVLTNLGDDVVLNRGTIDFVSLEQGNDRFDGRGGIVTGDVSGGLGDDIYVVSQSDISLIEDFDEGTDLVKSTVSFTLADNFEFLTLIGNGNIRGSGNAEANTISGNSGNNVLRGLGGNDSIRGGNGDDKVKGGRGEDSLYGDHGDDILRGGKNNDSLFGNDGDDILIGGLGKDRLKGGEGSDIFVFNRVQDSPRTTEADVIVDFELGIDRIDLSNLIAGELHFVDDRFFGGLGGVKVTTSDSDTFVKIITVAHEGVDMKIILRDVVGLIEDDFIL